MKKARILTIVIASLFFYSKIAIAQRIEIIPTSSMGTPLGQFIQVVSKKTSPIGIELLPTQKGSCGEAVDYYENAKGPIAIVWSDSNYFQSRLQKINCVIDFEKSTPLVITYSVFDVCVRAGTDLVPNQKYRLGNNRNNPHQNILTHMNTNNKKILFTSVTYANSAQVLQGLINREIDVAYISRSNARLAMGAGSIKCLYTTGDTKDGAEKLSEFLEPGLLNTHSTGMMLLVKNMSPEQIEKLENAITANLAEDLEKSALYDTIFPVTKDRFDKFISRAKVYGNYN